MTVRYLFMAWGKWSFNDMFKCQYITRETVYYCDQIERWILNLNRPDLWDNNSWHDNAPSHTALVLRDRFVKTSTNIVPQPPYSPDLAPCDFWLFSKLKRPLRGHRLDSIEEIKTESLKALKAIPEIEFNKCFDDWKNFGISALYRKGITLKGMKLIWINK